MGVVRRAALIFSLVLIVAIVVGYVARRSELAGQRDMQLTTAAELASARLDSIIDAAVVAADSGSDPRAAADAVVAAHPAMGVCAVTEVDQACSADGPVPTSEELADRQADRRSGDLRSVPFVQVYDSLMTIEADGPALSIVARGRADVVAVRSEVSTVVSTFLPAGSLAGEFAVDRGIRQTSTTVDAAPGVYVVASTDDDLELPPDEQRFYLIIFTLAVVLLGLAGITLIVEQRNLLERASFDPLTRLPNRSEFERRAIDALAVADRTERAVCLLLFDLNGFKQINDSHGHHVGDEILKVVASRLRTAVRDGDIVARWGGDEFVVVMPGIGTEEMGTRRARQLADAVGGRTRVDSIDEALRIKVSVGVSLWPDHGEDLAALVEAADSAMYQAKRDDLVCRVAQVAPPARPVGSTV